MGTAGLSPIHMFWPLWISHCLVFREWISQQSRKKMHRSHGVDNLPECSCVCVRAHTHACMHARLYTTLGDLMDCSPPGSSVHGIFQARIVERGAIFSSRGSSWPRNLTWVSCISCLGRRILCHWATWEACATCVRVQFTPRRAFVQTGHTCTADAGDLQ